MDLMSVQHLVSSSQSTLTNFKVSIRDTYDGTCDLGAFTSLTYLSLTYWQRGGISPKSWTSPFLGRVLTFPPYLKTLILRLDLKAIKSELFPPGPCLSYLPKSLERVEFYHFDWSSDETLRGLMEGKKWLPRLEVLVIGRTAEKAEEEDSGEMDDVVELAGSRGVKMYCVRVKGSSSLSFADDSLKSL
ncbi:hypothetical protein MNV49_001910 [Pseudohyphozyma bogoriensis]|nr:hypothetical protein MNV49_001910 [Pseudohyphozyma bogoriensis]